MKIQVIVDKNNEEKIVIYTKKETDLAKQIEKIVNENTVELLGYKDEEIVKLNPSQIYCVSVIDNKVWAILEKEKYLLKHRLYEVEGKLPENFVKINQSCIANINKINRFDASFSGTLKLVFKNGYTDYVSRRQLKKVKERIGI